MKVVENSKTLSGFHLFAMTVIGALLGLSTYPVEGLDTDIRGRAFATIFAAILLLLGIFLYVNAINKSKAYSFFELLQKSFGKISGKLIMLLFSLYFLVRAALSVTRQSSMVKLYLLEETPIELIMLFILFSSALAASCGLRALAYTGIIVIIIVALPLIFVIIAMIPKCDYGELRALMGVEAYDLKNELPEAMLSLSGCECGVIFIGKAHSEKSQRAVFSALGAISTLSLLSCVLTIGILSVDAADAVRFPFIEAAKLIDFFGASFSERIDLIPITIILLCLVLQIGVLIYCSASLLGCALGCDSPRVCIYMLPPIALLVCYYLGGTDIVAVSAVIGLMIFLIIALFCEAIVNLKDFNKLKEVKPQ